ncbi:MAG TPA: endopeptidase La [Spirochaetota bacterium]|nr:endopeptidase La [Spirochaetota bacterium]HOM87381.1 endopeptidase La [Spirochaetota bacterium]HOR92802.1 endopeptidase La [Spirochaetota bacterium]HPD04753.1 endopeptidase La [Spirochaetota bacterium]HRR60058.1 endopeptidase La [Spirochaetota bacterium]
MPDDSQNIIESKHLILPSEILPEIIPIIPISHRPIFPGMMVPLVLTGDTMLNTARAIAESDNKIGGVVLIQNQREGMVSSSDLYKVGVSIKILKIAPIDENTIQVMVNALKRFTLMQVITEEPVIRWQVDHNYEPAAESTDEMKAYSAAILSSVKELIKSNALFQEELKLFLNRFSLEDPGKLADFVASLTSAEPSEVQEVLETFDVKQRVEKVLLLLKKELELSKLQKKISQQIEERIAKNQKEFFLREQLKEIKKELGLEKDEKTSEIEKFEERVKKLRLSEEALKRFDEEIEKLKVLEPHSAEYGVSRNYLDWLTSLPWGVFSEDNYDIHKAKKILDRDHYGLQDIKDRILEFISAGKKKGNITGSIICFVGPPGVGKTSIGKSVAAALNRKFYRFSLGGMRDEAEIKGHRRTYIGAMPGKIIQSLKVVETSNPVIMLDEIDKIGASFQGDPASALLEVLDPEQNSQFLDHYVDVRYDLSNVLFIATANQLDTIPLPLMDRMEIMHLSGYILEEKLEIAKRYLIPKQLKEHGLLKNEVKIDTAALKKIIDGYAREAGVRSLENNIKKIMRKSTRQIIEGTAASIMVTPENLEEFLGKPRFTDESLYKKPIPGVVMGLAWTSMGGATLYIEATAIPSKTKGFTQTGQLGNVMKESTEIAYSYIRSRVKQFGIDPDFFENHFIHLHVPAGATPKDGPSAGITMATALYSLAKNKPIKKSVAMTGELTITGRVLPIGGVKEKTIAAKRAAVKTIIYPIENKKDFDELPEHIKKGIDAHFVTYFEEVLDIVY